VLTYVILKTKIARRISFRFNTSLYVLPSASMYRVLIDEIYLWRYWSKRNTSLPNSTTTLIVVHESLVHVYIRYCCTIRSAWIVMWMKTCFLSVNR